MTINKVRSNLYLAARLLGDLNALGRGPMAIIRRLIRKKLWKVVAGITR